MPRLLHSLKFQLGLALALQAAVVSAIVGWTLYEIELRKHDYAILNLTGQLRVIGARMVRDADAHLRHGIDDAGYRRALTADIGAFDRIIEAFRQRELPPALTGTERPLYCNWDAQSRSQLDLTAATWDGFRNRLQARLDGAARPATAAARYVSERETALARTTAELSTAFQGMMEAKLAGIERLNQLAIAASVGLGLVVLGLVYLRILRPLDTTVTGFRRVAQGELNHRVPVAGRNEIGTMTRAFNGLAGRIAALFSLTDRINQARNLDDTIAFVHEAFGGLLPLDWVGLVRTTPDGGFAIERAHGRGPDEGETLKGDDTLIARARTAGMPATADIDDGGLARRLREHGCHAAIALPLATRDEGEALLVLAAVPADAYAGEHRELLTNIAGQVGHAFDRSLGMEGLVVSAVEGLARLAESRDPETGDHLYRMSMYAAIVAREMGHDPGYVRDIHRFAPMHDIGKVGIADAILLKPGRLTDEERADMERHPVIGADVLRRCEEQMQRTGHSVFRVGIEIAEGHHEKFDGSGYPHGRSGEDIPLAARIVAVADVFDALTSRRPYKAAWSVDDALALLREEAGRHFDPAIVDAFERALPRILEVYDAHKHV